MKTILAGDVLKIQNGYAFKSTKYSDKKGLPIIRISDITGKEVNLLNCKKYPEEYLPTNYENFLIKENDILMALSGATVGKLGKYKHKSPALLNQRVGKFVFNKDIAIDLQIFIVEKIAEQVLSHSYGAAQPNISSNDIYKIPISIPTTIEEQNRLSRKIKECFNYLDNAEEKLKIAASNFDKVMDSALVKYIDREGRLNNWDYKEIGEISTINPTKSEIKDSNPDTRVSFVQMSSVSDKTGTIEEQETKTLKEVKKGYTYFRKGDIIFAKITPCMENGKCSLTENLNFDIGFGSTEFHVIRVDRKKLLPEYLYTILRSQKFRRLAMTNMTGTAGQKRLPKEYLSSFKIYVPNKEKQIEIVNKLKGIEKERVRYNLIYQSSIKNISLLRQSILKKAFEGKLI